MIRLPLTCHGSPHYLEARVGLDEDAFSEVVRLELELGKHELVSPDVLGDGIRLAVLLEQYGPARVEANVVAEDRDLYTLTDEIRRLRRHLRTAAEERELRRELHPDEARALAAMLRHYAEEATR